VAESCPLRHVAPAGTPSGQTCFVGATSVESGVLTHAVKVRATKLDKAKRKGLNF
jgi:hypothetical protein